MNQTKTKQHLALRGPLWVLLAVLSVAGGFLLAPATMANGSGIQYTFYATPACQVVVGSQIFNCPGFPFENDNDMQTPYYTTQVVQCDCSGGGGNQEEGDED